MTLENLKACGANTAEGLARCMNNEPLYLRLVGMALVDGHFDALKTALEAGDARAAFEAAHALKGTFGNLALTPIYEPVCALTELLRNRDVPAPGGEALLAEIMAQREKALSL